MAERCGAKVIFYNTNLQYILAMFNMFGVTENLYYIVIKCALDFPLAATCIILLQFSFPYIEQTTM